MLVSLISVGHAQTEAKADSYPFPNMFVPGCFFWRSCGRILLVVGCCMVGLVRGTLSAQPPEELTRAFDLPAEIAEKTLKLFSEQSGRGLIVAAEMATTVRTNAVRGQYTAREALERMLTGTGLVAKEDPKNGAFVVHRENPGPNGQRAAQGPTRDRPTS